jgi:hypothetical protein
VIVVPLCDSDTCLEPAAFVVHWPGKSLKFCPACKLRAEGVASAMGFDLTVEPLPPPEPEPEDPTEAPTPQPRLAAHLPACNPDDGCVAGCPVLAGWRP